MILQMPSAPTSPTIDAGETRRAAAELAGLIDRVGPDSVPGMVLRQAQRELTSLLRSAAPAEVVGPVRIRVAA